MTAQSKIKGSSWERDLVKILNDKVNDCDFRRIYGSGSIGTTIGNSELMGDINGVVKGFPKKIKIECKVGFGGEKQLTVKREWINKIIKEAEGSYSYPLLIAKFSGARKADGVQEFVVIDIDNFIELLNYITDLSNELDILYEKGNNK